MLPARLRTDSGWSDACILNISSRGLLIHARRPAILGSRIEVRHGEHAIVARVIWSRGPHVGLHAEYRLPVDQILSLSQTPALQLTAVDGNRIDRRKRPRGHENGRLKSRAMEFTAIAFIALSLSSAAAALVAQALAEPMSRVRTALTGGAR